MDDRRYYYRKDIHIADWLLSFRDKLIEEYLAYHPDYQTTFSKGQPLSLVHNNSSFNNWKMDWIKIIYPDSNAYVDPDNHPFPEIPAAFPTASNIARELGKHCEFLGYSTIDPHAVIERHTDPRRSGENTNVTKVRIHVPLIIPEGDVWFETEGEEMDWSDLWAFNNQYIHSAYNETDLRRLTLLVDVDREFLGLNPATPYDEQRMIREFSKPYYHVFENKDQVSKYQFYPDGTWKLTKLTKEEYKNESNK
jgi:hypothetical protein